MREAGQLRREGRVTGYLGDLSKPQFFDLKSGSIRVPDLLRWVAELNEVIVINRYAQSRAITFY